jgi:glycosyltransferase involved in cell wall biosynthesis
VVEPGQEVVEQCHQGEAAGGERLLPFSVPVGVRDRRDAAGHVSTLEAIPRATLVSFRLGGTDGVAVESAKWAWALRELGWEVSTVAGEGPVDRVIPQLAIGVHVAPDRDAVAAALDDADVVVVENLCSLPLNPAAADVVADLLRGRPAVFHHHDLPWQRPHLAHLPGPPDDPAWAHVTINDVSRRELAERGIDATRIYNRFDPDPPSGDGGAVRAALGVGADERLVLQPTRALARKGVPQGVALAEALRAVFWILGPAEDGYDLDTALSTTTTRTIVGRPPRTTVHDWYKAADVVAFPSSWEGFGNPTIESAVHDRPLAVGRYPVAEELRAFGFRWHDVDDLSVIDAGADVLAHNHDVARRHFDLAELPNLLAGVLGGLAR